MEIGKLKGETGKEGIGSYKYVLKAGLKRVSQKSIFSLHVCFGVKKESMLFRKDAGNGEERTVRVGLGVVVKK